MKRLPKYCFHKATGQARVCVDGRDHYLGEYDSPESRRRYAEIIERLKRQSASQNLAEIDIASLALLYHEHCKSYYVKDGKHTSEVASIKAAVKPLLKLYRNENATDFTPSKLRHVRDSFLRSGLTRRTINKHIGRIVRLLGGAVSMEHCPIEVLMALKTVDGLKARRTTARECPPVLPVNIEDVMAIEGHIGKVLWGVILFQRHTAARPGEALTIRGRDLDCSDDVWIYRPASHKTIHHGKHRAILIGPRCKDALQPFLKSDPNLYLFGVPGSQNRRPYQRHSYTVAVRRG